MHKADPSKKTVQKYWDEQPCDTPYGMPFSEGSLEFFENMEKNRYEGQAFIHSFAQFTRWHGKKVLEAGCGCGTDLLQFARAGAEVYATDLSWHSIGLTKKRLSLYGLQAEVIQGDNENLPFSSNQFDLVYCWGVLHHTPLPRTALEEIYRVLKPGGFIKAMVYHRISMLGLESYLKQGLFKGRPFISLAEAISEGQENPGTKAFTIKEIRNLFSPFSNLKIQPILLHEVSLLKGLSVSWLMKFYPAKLASWIAVEGQKS